MARVETTSPAARRDDETLIPYLIATLTFCLVTGLLAAASPLPLAWLPGQFPLLIALCYAIPLATVFARRYRATLNGLAAREYAPRERFIRVVAFAALLVALPALEWLLWRRGVNWRNWTFGGPVLVSLAASALAWEHAAALYGRWRLLHPQEWEGGAGAALTEARVFAEQGGDRVDRTWELRLLWRDFTAWGLVLGLALFAAASLAQPSRLNPALAALLFAGYLLFGLLLIGRAALLRLVTEWRLGRVPVAGEVGRAWQQGVAALIGGVAALILLLLLAHVLDAAHVLLYALWLALAPLIVALIALFGHLFTGGSQQQSERAIRHLIGVQGQPPLSAPNTARHAGEGILQAIPWLVGLALVLLLVRSYLEARKYREPGRPWWYIFRAMLVELRRLLRALLGPARALAGQAVAGMRATAAGAMGHPRRSARRGAPSPREAVVRLYMQALVAAARRGHPRRAGQAPGEYAAELGARLQSERAPLDDLTASFVEARYGPRAVSPDDVSRAQEYWRALRQALRGMGRRSRE